MHIYEIIVPGTWLDYEDQEWAWKINSLIHHLESKFYKANLALNLFMSAQDMPHVGQGKYWEDAFKRRWEIQDEIRENFENSNMQFSNPLASWEIAQTVYRNEMISRGDLPLSCLGSLSHMYAEVFLYALDSFSKFLKVLSEEKNVPTEVIENYKKISEYFPDLQKVRNTAQHLEDRSRGLGAGRNPKPLDLKPITNHEAMQGNILALGMLSNNKYGSTMADGHYGEIEVGTETMERLQEILKNVLNSFKWKGPVQFLPRIP